MRRMLPALLLSAALLAGCSAPGESTSASQSASSQPEGSQSSSSAQGGGTIRVQTDWSVLEGGEETLPTVWNRWYDSYTDHLISRKDYGTLLPYVGARVTIQPMEGESQDYLSTSFLYGLMTQEGTVVMDPVCTSIYRVSYSTGVGDSVPLPVLALEKGDKERGDPSDGSLIALASADGSWCTDFVYWGCAASPTAILAGGKDGMDLLAPETGEAVKEWSWAELGIDDASSVPWFTGDAYSSLQWTGDRFFLGCYGANGDVARFLDPMTGEVTTSSAQAWYDSLDQKFQSAPQTWWDAKANGDGTYILTMGDESHTITAPLDMGDALPYVSGGDRVIFEDGQGAFAVTDLAGKVILPKREGTLAVLQNDWEGGSSWLAVRLEGEPLWLLYNWDGTLAASFPWSEGSWCSTSGSLVEVCSDTMSAYYRPEDGKCVLRVYFGLPG